MFRKLTELCHFITYLWNDPGISDTSNMMTVIVMRMLLITMMFVAR